MVVGNRLRVALGAAIAVAMVVAIVWTANRLREQQRQSGSAAATTVHAKPQTIADRLNHYFDNPDEPETFRALASEGDPKIEPEDMWSSRFAEPAQRPDHNLFLELFPDVPDEDSYELNGCRPDYAVETLRRRIALLGERHPYVRQWIETQKAVFSRCRGNPQPLPPPLETTDPKIAKLQSDDRAYQVASLAFYNGDTTSALTDFSRIGQSDSPHRPVARYMVAAIRAGSIPNAFGNDEPTPLVPAEQSIAEIQAILADPSLASVHPAAQKLLGWIGYHVGDTVTRRAQVQATLAALELRTDRLATDADDRRRYALARADIDGLHLWGEHDPGWWLGRGPPADYAASRAMMNAARTDPMAAWLLFPQSYTTGRAWAPFAAARAKGWSPLYAYAERAAKGTDPTAFAWSRVRLSVSRTYASALWADIAREEAGAGRGDDQSIAALSFDFYHQVRLALSAENMPAKAAPGRFEKALGAMKDFPFQDAEIWHSARGAGLAYLMAVGRVAEARRWRDELYPVPDMKLTEDDVGDTSLLEILAEDERRFAAVIVAGQRAYPPSFRSTTTWPDTIQNNLSIGTFTRLAARSDVPTQFRARFARTAWARTYALGRPVGRDLNQLMRNLNPQITAGWTSRADQPVRPDDRQALLDVLRTPGLNILIVDTDRDVRPAGIPSGDPGPTGIDFDNHDDDNWWCSWNRARNARDLKQELRSDFVGRADLSLVGGDAAYDLRKHLRPVLAASFAFRSQDPAEIGALSKIPCAPKLLTLRVLDWVAHARSSVTNSGQAEALALAVKTTRYGCYSDGSHGAYSRAAWTLLHQRYPDSEWAARTKYWFNCPLVPGGCLPKKH